MMKKLTKWLALLMAGLLVSASIAACGEVAVDNSDDDDDEKEEESIDLSEYEDLAPEEVIEALEDAKEVKITIEIVEQEVSVELLRDGNAVKVTSDEITAYADVKKGIFYEEDDDGNWQTQEDSDYEWSGLMTNFVENAEIRFDLFAEDNYTVDGDRYDIDEDLLADAYDGYEASLYMKRNGTKYSFVLKLIDPDTEEESTIKYTIEFKDCTVKLPKTDEDENPTTTLPAIRPVTTVKNPSGEVAATERPDVVVTQVPDAEPDYPTIDPGYEEDVLSPRAIYDRATENMNALNSYKSVLDAVIVTSMMDEEMTTTLYSLGYIDAIGGRMQGYVQMDLYGMMSYEVESYFDNEVYMMSTDGIKQMAPMTAEKHAELMGEQETVTLDFDDFKDYDMYYHANGYSITVVGLKSGSAVAGMLDGMVDENSDIDLDSIELTFFISEDFYIEIMTLSMEMTTNSGDPSIGDIVAQESMTITYSDFDEAVDQIVKPSTVGYEEVTLEELVGA